MVHFDGWSVSIGTDMSGNLALEVSRADDVVADFTVQQRDAPDAPAGTGRSERRPILWRIG
jgi:hypothetical protein